MPRPTNAVPVYRRHKPTNQAVCTVRVAGGGRKDLYLGRWGSAASKAEYNRVVALIAANGGTYPDAAPDLTINEALLRFVKHAERYYVGTDGRPTRSVGHLKSALGYLRRLFGSTPLADFGPVELKAVRQHMIDAGIVRTQINKHVGTVRQFYRWCVEAQLVPSSVWETLRAVRPLTVGRSGAKEGAPRLPSDPTAVQATLPFMTPAVRAVVQFLRLTGARPTEALTLRPCDLNRGGEIWTYQPDAHKGSWRGKPRVVYVGSEAQAVLAPWLLGTSPESYVFCPARSEEIRSQERAAARRTPRWRSHLARNEMKRAKKRRLPQLNGTATSRWRRPCAEPAPAPM
jgi:integrase